MRRFSVVKNLRRAQVGQVSLIMMLNFIPSIMLFAFVINLGMLVHAKINLQNAADAAAFTGAAAEARLMNRISHLNYAMRMNYKKFLYRYYIIGNSNLACFPGRPGAPAACTAGGVPTGDLDPFRFENRLGSDDQPKEFPSVPSVCIPPRDGTNPCRLNSKATRKITEVMRNLPVAANDPVAAIVQARIAQIADLASQDCSAKGRVNSLLALSWLYNTDTENGILGGINDLKHLSKDLGIIPANLLLLARIGVLQSYLNAPPRRDVNIQAVKAMEQERELAAVERTVLAFKSAHHTLSTGGNEDTAYGVLQNNDDIKMHELIPSGSPSMNLIGGGGATADLLNLDVLYLPAFSIFYTFSGVNSPTGEGGGAAVGNDDCGARLGFIPVPNGTLPLGVYKSKNHRAYYAVALDAKAHLMFNPFGEDLRLRAYSAAAPFGSRIGPYYTDAQMRDMFLTRYKDIPRDFFLPAIEVPESFMVPSITFNEAGVKMEHNGMLRAYNNFLSTLPMPEVTGNRAATAAIHESTYLKATEVAVGPDPMEVGRYNIPVEYTYADASGQEAINTGFNKYFDPRGGYYHFWAPLQPLDNSRGGSSQTPAQRIVGAIQTFTGSTYEDATGRNVRVSMLNGLQLGLDQYLARISQPNPDRRLAEDTDRIVSLMNPLKQKQYFAQFRVGGTTKVGNPQELATSWPATNPAGITTREGYSVKIVSLSTLVMGGGSTPSGNTNNPDNDGPWAPVNPQEVEAGSTQTGMDLRAIHY